MFEFLGCPISVEPQQMSAIVRAESSAQQFAVGVVGHKLSRLPVSEAEALALVRRLREGGYNYSVGLAQVNQMNFRAYSLTTKNMFDRCANLAAGSLILKRCYEQYRNWSKAYSCYYSGNPKTGFDHGYVRKVRSNLTAQIITTVQQPKSSSDFPIQIFKRKGGSNVVMKLKPTSLLNRRLASAISIYP